MTKVGNYKRETMRNGAMLTGGHRVKYVSDDKTFLIVLTTGGDFRGLYVTYEDDGAYVDDDRMIRPMSIITFNSLENAKKYFKVGEYAEDVAETVEAEDEQQKAVEVKMEQPSSLTPQMKTFLDFKVKYPDAMLLYRYGDFYEAYNEDAVDCGKILGITVRKYHETEINDIKVAYFPHHALDTYLPKLILAGKRVAIVDHQEDPKINNELFKKYIDQVKAEKKAETEANDKQDVQKPVETKVFKMEAAEPKPESLLFLQPEKVCKGQNEMRAVLKGAAFEKGQETDRVLIRQVFGNGDYGVCLCFNDGEVVAMACWERTVNGSKREYHFCPLAHKFEALAKAI